MAVDQDAKKAYLFGGAGRKVPFDDRLYELDLATDVWHAVETTGDLPPSLQGASMTFDTKNHVIVLAGGLLHKGSGMGTMSSAWVFDPATNQWDLTDCGEALRRRDHLAAYDVATGQHILIGGRITAPVGNFYGRGKNPEGGITLVVQRAE